VSIDLASLAACLHLRRIGDLYLRNTVVLGDRSGHHDLLPIKRILRGGLKISPVPIPNHDGEAVPGGKVFAEVEECWGVVFFWKISNLTIGPATPP